MQVITKPPRPPDARSAGTGQWGYQARGADAAETELECLRRRDGRVSGLYTDVRFAGPFEAHSAQSDEMSGWLHDERRIVGRGAGAVEEGSWYWRVGG